MTAAVHALHPNYVVSPSPYPRPPYEDLILIAAESAERFSGLFAKAAALAWGFRHLANDAEMLAVELITRAVETTGDPNPCRRLTELSKKLPPRIGIRITHRGNGLLIEVWDSDSQAPSRTDAHLSTVGELSLEWSWYPTNGGGKVIWAELGIPRPRQCEPSQSLPRRTACRYSYPEPDQPVMPVHDPELLREVLRGLHNLGTDRGHRGEL